jgi:isopenicillin N synthase-like dioxygenase
MAQAHTEAQVVIVDWDDLLNHDVSVLQPALSKAFSSTGLICIRNVPGFVKAKAALLPQAHALVNLPADYLKSELTDATSLYNAGWSHGKERLGDKPDTAKGSFYFNPISDVPGTAHDRQQYPLSYPSNKWPTQKLPNFEPACKEMGIILTTVTLQLSRHIDRLASAKCDSYPENFLYETIKDTEKVKGRLLYYYPLDIHASTSNEEQRQDSWIGWHNDSGFLTALAGEIYVDHCTGQIVDCPDDSAGLYIVNRHDQIQHVTIPPDCCAVQIGECTQIVTGGSVTSTPHCVRGLSNGMARISLACFVDTPPSTLLTAPSTRQQVLDASMPSLLVPPLHERWTNDKMTFGEFLSKTFAMYYEWSKEETK